MDGKASKQTGRQETAVTLPALPGADMLFVTWIAFGDFGDGGFHTHNFHQVDMRCETGICRFCLATYVQSRLSRLPHLSYRGLQSRWESVLAGGLKSHGKATLAARLAWC